MTRCPPADLLARMIDGTIPAASRAALEAHVAGCERCAAAIATQRGTVRLRPQAAAAARPFGDRAGMREIESSATLASDEYLPIAATTPSSSPLFTPHVAAGTGRSQPPGATGIPHSQPPGPTGIPRSQPPGAGAPPIAAGTPRAAPRTPRKIMPRRRGTAIAIACVAAVAGVAAALAIAHVARGKSRQAPVRATSAAPATTIPAPSSTSPAPSSTSPAPSSTSPAPSSTSPAPAPPIESAPPVAESPPPKPAGVPLPPPSRAPAKRSAAAIAPSAPPAAAAAAVAAPSSDTAAVLTSFMRDVQGHIRRRDVRACKNLVAGLPKDLQPTSLYGVEIFAGFCDMLGGDCAGGTARIERVYAAQGMPFAANGFADQYCLIEGDLQTRRARLLAQTNLHTLAHSMDIAWCDALVPHARKIADEVTTGPDKAVTGYILQRLAGCFAHHKRCSDARATADFATQLDPHAAPMPELAAKCPSAP